MLAKTGSNSLQVSDITSRQVLEWKEHRSASPLPIRRPRAASMTVSSPILSLLHVKVEQQGQAWKDLESTELGQGPARMAWSCSLAWDHPWEARGYRL